MSIISTSEFLELFTELWDDSSYSIIEVNK